MPFPYHDDAWAPLVDLLRRSVEEGERVVAPDVFWPVLPVVHRYRSTWMHPSDDPDWLVVHKGQVEHLEPGVVRRALRERPVMFANAVFVVLGPERLRAEGLDGDPEGHVRALLDRLEEPAIAHAAPVADPHGEIDDTVLPDPGVIERFGRFDVLTMARAMDAFYEAGGYDYPTLRDKTYDRELDRHLRELAGPQQGRRIDLASGLGRVAQVLGAGGMVLSDISEVAVRRSRDAHPTAAGSLVMDACQTAVRSASVDEVILCDAFEHVHDARAALAEAARVLRPGGHLFVTANNRNSLNLRLTRALGHPEFVTNYQHITEIAFGDLVALLDDIGFDVVESRGLFLYPYWGVPGVDEHVRAVIDDDPEIVEVTRQLGDLVGAEHAFVSVVLARRR